MNDKWTEEDERRKKNNISKLTEIEILSLRISFIKANTYVNKSNKNHRDLSI